MMEDLLKFILVCYGLGGLLALREPVGRLLELLVKRGGPGSGEDLT